MKKYINPFLEIIVYTEDFIVTSPGQYDNTKDDIDWDSVDEGF